MRALAPIVVLVVLVAGCADTPADDPALNASSGPLTAGGALAVPAGGANATMDLGHMPHLHDYWAGKDRVTLYDGEITPPGPDEALFQTFVNAFVFREAGKAGGVDFFLPDGQIVYEGTGVLELTASWTDPTVTSVAVRYRSAAGPELAAPVALPNGEAVAIDVAPEMTDMPHTAQSRWAFRFEPAEPGALVAPFQLRVDIVRVRDIMEFPGHPELFFGKPEKVLLDADGRSAQVSYAKRTTNVVTAGEFTEHWIVPEQIVPMETKAVTFDVTVTSASASVGEVSEIRAFYSTADSRAIHRLEPVALELGTPYRWTLPVEMENTDSPYAATSQWRFLVEAATSATGQDPTCGGCVDTDIEFHVTITAYDHELEDADEGQVDG